MDLSYNISFELAGTIVLALVFVFMRMQYVTKTPGSTAFVQFVVILFVAEVLDIVTAFTNDMAGTVPLGVSLFLCALYFAASGVCEYLLVNYIRSYAKNDRVGTFFKYLDYTILAIYLALIVGSMWNGLLFSFPDCQYTHGPLYFLVYAVPLYYLIDASIIALRRHSSFSRKQHVANVGYVAITLLGLFLQGFIFTDVLLTWFGASISVLLLLFVIETPDYPKLVATMDELNKTIDKLNEANDELNGLKGNLENEVARQTALATQRLRSMQEMTFQTVQALANSIDAKDAYTNGHSHRVSTYAALLAKELGWDRQSIEDLRVAALLHDIGKIGVPDAVLNKHGRLTDSEYLIIKSHTTVGYEIVSHVTGLPGVVEVVRSHHERWDGTGYPDGLSGTDIPESARIVGIADAYDAMNSNRVYRNAMQPDAIREELTQGRGTQFDPEKLDIFLRLFDEGALEDAVAFAHVDTDSSASKSAADLILENFSAVYLSQALSDEQDHSNRDYIDVDLNLLARAISPESTAAGPLVVQSHELARQFDYAVRLDRRYSTGFSLAMLTLNEKGAEKLANEQLDAAMTRLKACAHESIRAVDVCSQFSSVQLLVIFLGANRQTARTALDRIVETFSHSGESDGIEVHYQIANLAGQTETGEN